MAANVSSEEIRILRSEPLRVLTAEGGGCLFGATGPPGFNRVRKALTNGRIYYDPGRLVDFSPAGPGEMESSWNIAFFCPETRETMVAGYLENREAEGTIRAGWCPAAAEPLGRAAFNLAAHSQYNSYYVLKPGSRTSSGRLLVLFTNDPHDGLETYARLSGQLHQVRLNPIINGWCSWFVTYGDVTEQEILKHAEHVARELKPYGMEWIQIDDGYQTAFGNWEGNSKFPHGMKWLASKIREQGLRP